jgi:predicted nuclease of predicted toxin-antitoxin system
VSTKLLLDQNISYKLVKKIIDLYPGSSHVRLENLQNVNDSVIREFALSKDFSIVTFDIDFYEMSLIHGYPPKIIWLRCGNSTTLNIQDILRKNYNRIKEFLENNNFACIELL